MVTKEEKIKAMLSEIGKHEGVESVVLADESGFPLSSTIPTGKAEKLSALVISLIGKVTTIINELELKGLKLMSVKTNDREILVTPHGDSTLVVVRKS